MKNKTDLCDSYLKHLTEDPDARGSLVETLRASAARLVDTAALSSFGSADGAQVSATEAGVYRKLAGKLREAAASLCDHARTHGPHCRYCESVLPDARYDTDQLVRPLE